MFFDARSRFDQKRPNEYVRGLLAQYGDRGKPVQLKRPSHFDAQEAAAFRQRELEEMKYAKRRAEALEKQLLQSRKDARILAHYAQQFLGQSRGDARGGGGGRELDNGHINGAPVLLPKGDSSDAHDARRAQEINSGPTTSDARGAGADRSGRGTGVVLEAKGTDSRGDVQPGTLRDDDDEERSPTGAADPPGHASEHGGA